MIDDIITCTASIFIRKDYIMNHEFNDFNKDKNYIGFDSGVMCIYPNYVNDKYVEDNDFGCKDNDWYRIKYLNNDTNATTPVRYDPRCRVWFKDQY